jgi:hypothetical protein
MGASTGAHRFRLRTHGAARIRRMEARDAIGSVIHFGEGA